MHACMHTVSHYVCLYFSAAQTENQKRGVFKGHLNKEVQYFLSVQLDVLAEGLNNMIYRSSSDW